MRLIYLFVLTILQALMGFGFGCMVCMAAAICEYKGGFDGLVGLTVFQPLWAILLSGLSVFLCILVGLPIRLSKRVNTYWSNRLVIPLSLFIIGLALLLLSFNSFQKAYYVSEGIRIVPDQVLAGIGWFTAIFSLVHLFPPKSVLKFVKRVKSTDKFS